MLFVDTSVWSLAFRRDHPPDDPRVHHLHDALTSGRDVATTGLVLQEVLQGVRGPTQRALLLDRFAVLAMVMPDRDDHLDAAEVRNRCRGSGVQLGTIDALLAALCLRRRMTMLTADGDFTQAARVVPLEVWPP